MELCFKAPDKLPPGAYVLTMNLQSDGRGIWNNGHQLSLKGQEVKTEPPPKPEGPGLWWPVAFYLGLFVFVVFLLKWKSQPESSPRHIAANDPSDTGEFDDDFADNEQGIK